MLELVPSIAAQLKAARRASAEAPTDWHETAPSEACPMPRLDALHPGTPLIDAAVRGRTQLRALLDMHGAVVLGGFELDAGAGLQQLTERLCGGAIAYVERSTPRRQLGERVYSVTEYPAHQRIDLHCENAYAHEWPGTLLFWCVRPADQGGENLLADMRQVFDAIPLSTRQRFERRKVLYRRELGPPLGMPWQTVFQCQSRAEAQAMCDARGYAVVWHDEQRATLTRVAEATIEHPGTGQASWFNHALFFHESSLEPTIREGLRQLYGGDYLPHRSAYGDGGEIAVEDLSALRRAYGSAERRLRLNAGEVLVIDNLLMAHGRCPFVGQRDIRLVMGGLLR